MKSFDPTTYSDLHLYIFTDSHTISVPKTGKHCEQYIYIYEKKVAFKTGIGETNLMNFNKLAFWLSNKWAQSTFFCCCCCCALRTALARSVSYIIIHECLLETFWIYFKKILQILVDARGYIAPNEILTHFFQSHKTLPPQFFF